MPTVLRVDRFVGRLGKVERTSMGGIRVPATIAKVGILEYTTPRGVIREYNPPNVLQDALASLRDAPVTLEHPTVPVRTDNFREHARGTVSGDVRFENEHIAGTLAIQDAQLIKDIDAKKRQEVSAGYSAEVDYTPGVTPAGEAYDGIRTSITYNHVAVVTRGRAGSSVSLMLDSCGNQVFSDTDSSESQVKLKIKGKEVSAEQAQDAITAAEAVADAEISRLKTEVEQANARADKAEAKLDMANDPSKLDALVAERAELETKARAICGDKYDVKGKTPAQIRADVAAKAFPHLDLKGKPAMYVDTLYDAAKPAASTVNDAATLRGKPKLKVANDAADETAASEDVVEDSEDGSIVVDGVKFEDPRLVGQRLNSAGRKFAVTRG